MARLVTFAHPNRALLADRTHRDRRFGQPRPRRDDEYEFEPPFVSTAQTLLEYDPEPLGVLVYDHKGNPLIARVKDRVGFRPPWMD